MTDQGRSLQVAGHMPGAALIRPAEARRRRAVKIDSRAGPYFNSTPWNSCAPSGLCL
jgi:hypothetical protein